MATPLALSSSRMVNSASTSLPVNAAVSSSRIRMRAFIDSALAISMSCCLAIPSSPTGCLSGTSKPIRFKAACAWALRCLRLTMPKRFGVRPSMIFSATDSVGTKFSSWWIVAIPCASESLVEAMVASEPSTRILPESGWCMPAIILISVDLPAPFSPSSAWTCPRRTDKVTSLITLTGPKDLETLTSCKTVSSVWSGIKCTSF